MHQQFWQPISSSDIGFTDFFEYFDTHPSRSIFEIFDQIISRSFHIFWSTVLMIRPLFAPTQWPVSAYNRPKRTVSDLRVYRLWKPFLKIMPRCAYQRGLPIKESNPFTFLGSVVASNENRSVSGCRYHISVHILCQLIFIFGSTSRANRWKGSFFGAVREWGAKQKV